ncbi:hypothetical protein [Acetobacter malorum]|uniref:Sialate O-acetylesterase domain-containing protein n=1 Tax=Acetobacter malorum TaxID=178901 RepID=A0A1Y3GAQ1_9PROT|nr:hypothetical protein [Acetobacter malorum]OUJ06667.1 hypothetical protein HK23_14445 [Acetobacter malorum]
MADADQYTPIPLRQLAPLVAALIVKESLSGLDVSGANVGDMSIVDYTKAVNEATSQALDAADRAYQTSESSSQSADAAANAADSAVATISGAAATLAQNTALASLVANNPAQFTNRGGWDAAKNSPALASGVGAEGDLYIVTVAGAATLDGVADWSLLDGAWYHNGAWQRLANAGYPTIAQVFQGLQGVIADGVTLNSQTGHALTLRDVVGYVLTAIDGAGNISTAGKQLLLGSTLLDCNAKGNFLFRQRDNMGNVAWGVREDGSPAFPQGAARADLGPISVTTNSGGAGVLIKDKNGFIVLDTSGTYGTSAVDFSAEEIAERDRMQLARSAAVMAGPGDLLRARPVWGISVSLATGQSEMMGYVSLPALSITQPHDNITFGQDPRGQVFGDSKDAWTPRGGDPSPMPLVAVNVSQTDFSTLKFPSALVYKPSTVDVTVPAVTSGNPKITLSTNDTSIDFTTGFSVGQVIQCAGFTGAAAKNNETGGLWYSNYVTLTSVAAQTITGTCDGVWWGWTPVAVTGATGVSIAPLRITRDFGEQQSIAALNFFRGLQLDQRQMVSDSTRRLALLSTCVSGMPLYNLSKGEDNNVYLRNLQSATIAKQQADKLGVSSGIFLIEFCQGGSETTTNYDTYGALLSAYFSDIKDDLMPIFGQDVDPFIEIVPISGMNMPSIGYNDIARAQVDYVKKTPGAYIATVGYPAIDYGFHYSSNGERYVAAMRAKVRHRIINQGMAWRPLIMEKATLRGKTILLDCHVPYSPMQVLPCWRGQSTVTFDDLGFGVYDGATGATLPIASAEIVGETQIEITLGSAPSAPVWVTYGDSSHQGSGNVFDSDPAVSRDVYQWWEGNGAPYSENISDLLNKPYSLQNPMINYALKSVEG